MSAEPRPAPAEAPAAPLDAGALWKRIVELAEGSPRDQATVDEFAPVAWDGAVLAVRPARAGGASGSAICDMLAAVASRAAGRPVRVRVDAPPPALRPAEQAAPPARVPGRAPSLRDDPVAAHPLVREVSALFDATIVRVEAAGTLPEAPAGQGPPTGGPRDDAEPAEQSSNGDSDV